MPLGKVKLSDEDAKKVAVHVAALLAPKAEEEPKAEPVVEVQEISDPAAKAYHDTEVELIKQLANPRMVQVITKKGARLHNMTENALNALHDLGRDRKSFKQYM